MTPEQIAEGRRLLEAWRASESTGFLSERLSAMEMACWLTDNASALLDAAEDAERELAEVQRDAERFEWWFNRDVDKRDFMPTYFQGIRERWSLSNWRAAIDAERGK